MSDAVFCAIEADGRTWHHNLSIEEVEGWEAPAIVVAECELHPHVPRPPGLPGGAGDTPET